MPSRGSGFYLQGWLEGAASLYRAGSRERLATESRKVRPDDEKIFSAAAGGLTWAFLAFLAQRVSKLRLRPF